MEETVAYKELVAIGEKKGRIEEKIDRIRILTQFRAFSKSPMIKKK